MFKNLSVGKKIGVIFGSVIAIISVLLGVNVVTSFRRSDDLEKMNTLFEMQAAADNVLEHFNETRILAEAMFSGTDTQDIYVQGEAQMTGMKEHLAEMQRLSDELGGFMETEIAGLMSDVELWMEEVSALQSLNDSMMVNIEDLGIHSDILVAASRNLYEQAIDSIVGRTEDGRVEDVPFLVETVLFPCLQMAEDIGNMRTYGVGLHLAYDKAAAEQIYEYASAIETLLAPIGPLTTTDEERSVVRAMEDSLAAYTAALDEFVQGIYTTDIMTEGATARMQSITVAVESVNAAVTQEMGGLIVKTNRTTTVVTFVMLGLAVLAVGGMVAMAIYLVRSITRPLGLIKHLLLEIGEEGELAFTEEIREQVDREAGFRDEVGQSLDAFRTMVRRQEEISHCLQEIAGGELCIELPLLSERDTIGHAVNEMADQLNTMFSDIGSVSSQVAMGSNEISLGAQNLAQGASEQAATVQQISASIGEINQRAADSVALTRRVADEGDAIRVIAQQGNEKMHHMNEAMQEIHEASQSIGQVIKVIDDIAFQTNILSLNAAVEAARAGEHGRGFAVVANEVRTLAAKSADAAKETAVLISANIDKAELGLAISGETGEALEEIVHEIENTSKLLKEVAELTEGASIATAQVSTAVDQVALVVQKNSATSEQSAAASEEMSSQAQVLQDLILRFHLKEQGPLLLGGGPGGGDDHTPPLSA